jgi:hypothetical protein
MNPSTDTWFYSINENKTQAVIVDVEGFTVLELHGHWADLESISADICKAHNLESRYSVEVAA